MFYKISIKKRSYYFSFFMHLHLKNLCHTLTAPSIEKTKLSNPTCMKNSVTVLADAPTTSLKLVHSYLIPQLSTVVPVKSANPVSGKVKTSPFKSLFAVHPEIKNATAWDADWFGNYE